MNLTLPTPTIPHTAGAARTIDGPYLILPRTMAARDANDPLLAALSMPDADKATKARIASLLVRDKEEVSCFSILMSRGEENKLLT